jgi:hypothetical protein
MGLNGKQAQKLVDLQAQGVAELRKSEREELQKTDKAYREKWGANFDRNKAIVSRTIERMDPEKKLRTFFDQTGLGNHPIIIDLFHQWGKRLVEDGLMPGDVQGITGREEAKTKIDAIMADKDHPYHKSKTGDPAFEEVKRLNQIAWD